MGFLSNLLRQENGTITLTERDLAFKPGELADVEPAPAPTAPIVGSDPARFLDGLAESTTAMRELRANIAAEIDRLTKELAKTDACIQASFAAMKALQDARGREASTATIVHRHTGINHPGDAVIDEAADAIERELAQVKAINDDYEASEQCIAELDDADMYKNDAKPRRKSKGAV